MYDGWAVLVCACFVCMCPVCVCLLSASYFSFSLAALLLFASSFVLCQLILNFN